MAWEKGRVSDGDPIYHVSPWREMLEREMGRVRHVPFAQKVQRAFRVEEDEVMLKHPNTGASIRLKDDGSIELFSKGAGLRLTDEGIEFFGKDFVFSGEQVHLYGKTGMLSENGVNVDGKEGVRPMRESTRREIAWTKGGAEDVD